jgi:anti-sigma regulatory factor (Ser/Thr protein kinase)
MTRTKAAFTLRNELCELDCLRREVEEFGERHELPVKTVFQITLVLDEITTNIISYGFPENGEHLIRVELAIDDDKVVIRMEDDGLPFDPTTVSSPDLTCPLNERKVGGLGLHLVRELTDSIEYVRQGGRNILTMTKSIAPHGAG